MDLKDNSTSKEDVRLDANEEFGIWLENNRLHSYRHALEEEGFEVLGISFALSL
jgi:hypothetical protein